MRLERKIGFYEKYIKRLLDIVCSLIFIIAFCWLYVIIAVVVRIKMGSPVIFKQPRPGIIKNGKETIFDMYKFRSMTDERDENGKLLPDEKRLPAFGAFLRSTSLDELPEVFCILRGTMSVVGPRPQLVRDMVFMSDQQRMRHTAKPGLTGLAQVMGRNAITWEEKLDWDLKYIEKVSFLGDVKILFQTVVAVFKRSGITDGENVTALDYGDALLKAEKVSQEKYDALQAHARNLVAEHIRGECTMQIDGWKYYNHAAIPSTAPHESVNVEPVKNGIIWQIDGAPLLTRWQSDWDCGHETNWWYVIKDNPFDITALKSKRRYEINKGNKNFEVRKIIADDFVEDIFKVTMEAYKGWPEKYRPKIDKQGFEVQIHNLYDKDVFAGFERESGKLQGYAILSDCGSYVEFSVLRTDPTAEKNAINAAIVAGILEYYKERFNGKFYINDGSRAIRHETAFQDYLEKYFDFRKAYCHLNIKYKKGFGLIVKALYPFRHIINPDSKLGSKVSAILKMEEICRQA